MESATTTIATTNATGASTTTTDVDAATTTRIVSAPGKMLMAGGYLVLDPNEIGLVIGVNARFYSSCSIMTKQYPTVSSTTRCPNQIKIRVVSIQFQHEWNYIWDYSTFQLQEVVVKDDKQQQDDDVGEGEMESNSAKPPPEKKNPFLEKALRIVLLYIYHPNNIHNFSSNHHHYQTRITSMTIQIVGDNDFYSLVPHLQQRQLQKHQVYELPKCLPIVYKNDNSTGDIYKTGLGSSACLVTAVIGSILLTSFNTAATTTPTTTIPTVSSVVNSNHDGTSLQTEQQRVIERLSQIGHCYAQGKIGSGFDVAAAMYGSHIYQRFDPTILTNLLSILDHPTTNTTNDITTTNTNTTTSSSSSRVMNALYDVVHDNEAWKSNTIEPITCFAPKTFLQVMMADVSGGSESPSMAKQVLQWRSNYVTEQHQQQQGIDVSDIKVLHWDDLSIINRQIIHTLQQIHTLVPTADCELQQLYMDIPSDEWMCRIEHTTLTELLLSLKELYIQQRYHMKQMGIIAGNVPIEPDIQTSLCNDVTSYVRGVIATMVPGAGGYDAISILYLNHPTVHVNITNYLSNYIPQNVCALTVQGVSYNDGLRIETQFPI